MRALAFALVLSGTAYADSITVTTTTTIDLDPASALQPPGETPPRAPEPPAAPTFRLSVGVGPALGFDTKDACASLECVSAHAQIAAAIGPRLLVTFGSSIMTVPGDDKGLHNGVHHVETIGLQYWRTPQLWLEAGAGIGSKRSWSLEAPHDIMDFASADDWAPAGSVAVGYAPWRKPSCGFGVEARFSSTDDIHHTSFAQLLASFDWY